MPMRTVFHSFASAVARVVSRQMRRRENGPLLHFELLVRVLVVLTAGGDVIATVKSKNGATLARRVVLDALPDTMPPWPNR